MITKTTFNWMPEPYNHFCLQLQAKMIELASDSDYGDTESLWEAAAMELGNEDGRYYRIYVCEDCQTLYHADYSVNLSEDRDLCGICS